MWLPKGEKHWLSRRRDSIKIKIIYLSKNSCLFQLPSHFDFGLPESESDFGLSTNIFLVKGPAWNCYCDIINNNDSLNPGPQEWQDKLGPRCWYKDQWQRKLSINKQRIQIRKPKEDIWNFTPRNTKRSSEQFKGKKYLVTQPIDTWIFWIRRL